MAGEVKNSSEKEVTPLSDLEIEAIEYFVSFVQLLGLPKSVGEIYGVLFVSPKPMALDDIVRKLGISKGSASQGLNVLRNLGAIVPVYVQGDRRDNFEADFDLVRIFTNFSRDKLQPRLENGESRLERLKKLADEAESEEQNEAASLRIAALSKWQNRGAKLLPLVLKFLKATKRGGTKKSKD